MYVFNKVQIKTEKTKEEEGARKKKEIEKYKRKLKELKERERALQAQIEGVVREREDSERRINEDWEGRC